MIVKQIEELGISDVEVKDIVERVLDKNYKRSFGIGVLNAYGKSDNLREFFNNLESKVVRLSWKDCADIYKEAKAVSDARFES